MTSPPPDTSLDAIRREIDAIDDGILDLLLRRFVATGRVKTSKQTDGSLAVSPFRPAREASLLRRLVSRSSGTVTPQFLVRLWRVILAQSTQAQAPVTLHIDLALAADPTLRIMIAEHFPGMAVAPHATLASAFSLIAERSGDLMLVDPKSDWPDRLIAARGSGLRVIGALPVFENGQAPSLLILGHADPQPSGDDVTVLLMSKATAPVADRDQTCWTIDLPDWNVVCVTGFLDAQSPAFAALCKACSPAAAHIAGQYPSPIRLKP